MPLVYLLKLRHDVSSSIATVAFGVGGIIVMLIVFGGKYLSFFKLTISTSKVIDDSSINSKTMPLQILSQDIVRSMNQDEQYEYYTKIIQKYTALRLQIDCPSEKSSHSSNRVGNPSNPDPEKVITSNREKYATPCEEC